MPKHGGARPGGGRPRGSKTRNPLGNRPKLTEQIAAPPPELVLEVQTMPRESRREWREANRLRVAAELDGWLDDLVRRAKETGDLRAELAIATLRLQYAQGTAPPGEAPGETDFGAIVGQASTAAMALRAAPLALPPAEAEKTPPAPTQPGVDPVDADPPGFQRTPLGDLAEVEEDDQDSAW